MRLEGAGRGMPVRRWTSFERKDVNTGKIAAATGVSTKRIRHCEIIGLIRKGARAESVCRCCDDKDLLTLNLVQQARKLDFLWTR